MKDFKPFQTIDLGGDKNWNGYEELKKRGFVGFANRYLQTCVNSKSDDEIDIQVYSELVQLDSKLGTPASEQLFRLLKHSLRMDLLKVSLQYRNMQLKLFKVINMSEVDFDYQKDGRTIYINCFNKLL